MKRTHELAKGRSSRKNYVIKKERETWTDDEHSRFVAALQRHGKNWSMIEEAVGTKTVAQIRSHAQKYHEKQAKSDFVEQPICASSSFKAAPEMDRAISLPWLVTPDVLSEKPTLTDPQLIIEWMKKNKLYIDPKIESQTEKSDGTLQVTPTAPLSQTATSNQVPTDVQLLVGQALECLGHIVDITSSLKDKHIGGVVDWSLLYRYVCSLFEPGLRVASGVGMLESLPPLERQLVTENTVTLLSHDYLASKIREINDAYVVSGSDSLQSDLRSIQSSGQ